MDTRQKRMSAINVSLPFRGAMVDPTETGFDAGDRSAAMYLYSGIADESSEIPNSGSLNWLYIILKQKRFD